MKSYKVIIPAMVAAALLTAGVASAQSTTNVGATVTPTTSQISAGSGVTLGSVQFTGGTMGGTVVSFPITFNAANGGSLSNLSNCRAYDASGNAVSGTINPVTGGATSFAFTSPFTIGQSATSNFSVRCDVATSTPTGATFPLSIGTPVMAQGLLVSLDAAPSVPAGSTNVALANIMLDMRQSSGAVSVSAIPVAVTAGSGGSLSNLSNCRIRPSIQTGSTLTNVVALTGSNTFGFTTPFVASAGTNSSLALACDVSASTPIGSTFTIAITPSSITGTNVGTGGAAPILSGGASSGTVIVTATVGGGGGTTDPGTGNGTGTPGIPNTGFGGSMMALGILLLAALTALGGVTLLRRI